MNLSQLLQPILLVLAGIGLFALTIAIQYFKFRRMTRGPRRTGRRIEGYNRHPGSVWLDTHRNELPTNEWSAVDGSGVVASDPTIDGLMEKLNTKRVHTQDVTITFMEDLPPGPPLVRQSGARQAAPRQRHPGSTWLEKNWQDLPNNHWVASDGNSLVASDPDNNALYAKLEKLNIALNQVAVAFKTDDVIQ